MKKTLLLLMSGMLVLVCTAQYKPISKDSKVEFKIKNFGFSVTGSFTGLEGNIKFDPGNPGQSKFDVSIDASTVNTDNSMRDGHLRDDTYFDVKNYPKMHFVSTSVANGDKKGDYKMTGNLTIKNKTKEISFVFTGTESEGGWLFKGGFPLNRRDFEVGGSSTISDKLEVTLSVLAKKD